MPLNKETKPNRSKLVRTPVVQLRPLSEGYEYFYPYLRLWVK